MKAKILVVENKGIFTTTLRTKLKGWGYEVSEISSISGNSIENVQNIDPDLIIMDTFFKNDSDCIEASKLIDPEFKTPIIFYSSKIDEKLLKRVKSLPNRYHIQKSGKFFHLKRIMDSILKKADLNEKELKSIVNVYEKSLFAQSYQNDVENEFMMEIDDVKEPISVQNNDHGISKITENTDSLALEDSLDDIGLINVDHIDNYVFRENREEHLKFLKKLVATNFKKQDFYANLKIESTDTGEIIISKKGSKEYQKTKQKLEEELHNAEIHISELLNKTKTQETEIKQLKDTGNHQQILEKKLQNAEKHITQLLNKTKTQETEIKQLKDTGKNKQKLERKINDYKKHLQILEKRISDYKKTPTI